MRGCEYIVYRVVWFNGFSVEDISIQMDLKQRGSLSPFFFLLVVGVLSSLIVRDEKIGL